ncbi:MAG TPA: hypothetical protein VKP65_01035 [Rhodothermales bacterium]|nr:hypothetical protein [Rhodothermales bacterium]
MTTSLGRLHARIKQDKWLRRFTVMTRVLLAIAFLPSGLTKVMGNRFTLMGPDDNLIGYFFDALFQAGFYYNFIGLAQVTVAVLLLIPRTATLGAVLYFPIILNIWIITLSLHFRGTWVITSLMLLACVYLLCWDYDRLKGLWARRPEPVISM